MIDITLTINKAEVYDEVAKTTSYTGAKMDSDGSAYERIFTTAEDQLMLERFWTEACDVVTEQLKAFLKDVSEPSTTSFDLELELSSSFDETLTGSINTSLFSFFVNAVVSKWYKFTNKGEAESYAAEATVMMGDVMRKIYYRKKPKRTKPSVLSE